jgi:protein SCO1/2
MNLSLGRLRAVRAWRLAIVLAFGLGCAAISCKRGDQLEHYGRMPEFTLTNQRGQPFRDRDLRERVVVVDFIFTSCPDVCPLLTEQLAALRKQLPTDAALSFVSFSVDPEHDTPERLQAFARQHGVDVENFWFLTGPLDQIRAVVTKGFKQAMDLQPPREGQPRNVLHGSHFVLVDRAGEIRGFYANDSDGHAALKKAVVALLSE